MWVGQAASGECAMMAAQRPPIVRHQAGRHGSLQSTGGAGCCWVSEPTAALTAVTAGTHA